jgi:hypothetical protein
MALHQVCLEFCHRVEHEGVPTAEVKPERVAMELGDLSMLCVMLPTTIHAGWLFQARWPALFLAACQVRRAWLFFHETEI